MQDSRLAGLTVNRLFCIFVFLCYGACFIENTESSFPPPQEPVVFARHAEAEILQRKLQYQTKSQ